MNLLYSIEQVIVKENIIKKNIFSFSQPKIVSEHDQYIL